MKEEAVFSSHVATARQSLIDRRLVPLPAGSTKQDQRKAIRQAEGFLEDYHRRTQP